MHLNQLRPRARHLALLLTLLCAGGVRAQDPDASSGGEVELRMRPRDVVPGPGPNRMSEAEAAATKIGAGDTLGLLITFDPTSPEQTQPIRPRDTLQVSYYFAPPQSEKDYRAEVGDELQLDFRYSPELSQLYLNTQEDRVSVLSRPYVVQPEGTIALRGLPAPLRVVDLTTSQIAQRVTEAYRGVLQVPEVTVGIVPKYLMEERLRDALGKGSGPLTVLVGEDGVIALPGLPSLKTTGMSLPELNRRLTERYRELGFRRLEVAAWFELLVDERHEQLRRALRVKPLLSYEVDASGRISVPLRADLPVVGKTTAELSAELTAYYKERGLERARASIWIDQPRSRVLRVLGAVRLPGVYAFQGRADLWGTVALAGGFSAQADTSKVRVVEPGGKVHGPFNYQAFLTGDATQDMLLHGDELIDVAQRGAAEPPATEGNTP